MPLPIADAHTDVLHKLVFEETASFAGDSPLQASLNRLEAANVKTQVFALFIPTEFSSLQQLHFVLKSIDAFHSEVLEASDAKVQWVTDLDTLAKTRQKGAIAGILSVEGAGCLNGDTAVLRILHQLGVRGMGLTWNPANMLADGCGEPRNAGLTSAGRAVVKEMERLGMWVDLAHLSDTGVKDIFSLLDGTIMASHANARSVHYHPRNLTDETIREIIRRKGWMGLTFEGTFVSHPEEWGLDAILRHVDYILDLGGEDCLGFGSDFDGTFHSIPGLENAEDYLALREALVYHYGDSLAGKLLFENFERFLTQVLN